MPLIPKFAKVLVKLAKANPKVIPRETLPQIKKRDITEKQIKTKKFAKDDIELYKIRREKIRKELKHNFPNKSSDNSDLSILAKELKSVKTDDLKGNSDKISKYIKKFKKFLDIAKANLKSDDPAIDMFNELSRALDNINATTKSIPEDIKNIASKLHKEAEKRS